MVNIKYYGINPKYHGITTVILWMDYIRTVYQHAIGMFFCTIYCSNTMFLDM